jgi:hypothetical protein
LAVISGLSGAAAVDFATDLALALELIEPARCIMLIFLWIVFPLAVWLACMDQALSVAEPGRTPKSYHEAF